METIGTQQLDRVQHHRRHHWIWPSDCFGHFVNYQAHTFPDRSNKIAAHTKPDNGVLLVPEETAGTWALTFTPPVIIASFSTADKIAFVRVRVSACRHGRTWPEPMIILISERPLAYLPSTRPKAKVAHVVAEGGNSRDIVVRQDRAVKQAAWYQRGFAGQTYRPAPRTKILAKCAVHTHGTAPYLLG